MSQVCQFLSSPYPADIKECLSKGPENEASINMLAGDLDGEADYDLPDLTVNSNLESQTIILDHYERLSKACLVVSLFVPSWAADILSLSTRCVNEASRMSILEGCVDTLGSTLSTNDTSIEKYESQLVSKNSELNAALAEVE